jgi:uncharacterized protein YpbB
VAQLTNLFVKPQMDWNFIHERIQAAYTYFFKPLDGVYYSLLKRMAELQLIKKTKQYVDELEELEQQTLEVILRLKKVRLLVEAVTAGRELNKEAVWNEELKHYKLAKIAIIKQELREKPSLLDPVDVHDDFSHILSETKPKKGGKGGKAEKKEKKTTYEQTLELFREGKSLEEIARVRQMTIGTIYSHFMNLIKQEEVELEEIMSPSRIRELENYFDEVKEQNQSLSQLKEKLGDKVTWEELKLYQASTIR